MRSKMKKGFKKQKELLVILVICLACVVFFQSEFSGKVIASFTGSSVIGGGCPGWGVEYLTFEEARSDPACDSVNCVFEGGISSALHCVDRFDYWGSGSTSGGGGSTSGGTADQGDVCSFSICKCITPDEEGFIEKALEGRCSFEKMTIPGCVDQEWTEENECEIYMITPGQANGCIWQKSDPSQMGFEPGFCRSFEGANLRRGAGNIRDGSPCYIDGQLKQEGRRCFICDGMNGWILFSEQRSTTSEWTICQTHQAGILDPEFMDTYLAIAAQRKETGNYGTYDGSCIDAYSLIFENDCWDDDSLCVNGACIKLETMGLSHSILENLKSADFLGREQALVDLMLVFREHGVSEEVVVPILIKMTMTETELYVLEFLVAYLGEVGSEETISYLYDLFLTEDFSLRVDIINTLSYVSKNGEEGFVEATSSLITLFNTLPSNSVENKIFRRIIAKDLLNSYRDLPDCPIKESIPPVEQLLSLIPDMRPEEILEYLQADPLFNRIYSLYSSEGLGDPDIVLNSLATADYRYIKRIYGENPTDLDILSVINSRSKQRESFKEETLLGDNVYFINFLHLDPRLSSSEIREFALDRGVREENIYQNRIEELDSEEEVKQEIRTAIIDSNTKGKTTIWVETHGTPNSVCLGGANPSEGDDLSSCFGFNYEEFSDMLLERGNPQEVTLIINACFSYDFAEQLLNDLEEKGSTTFPTIITETNKGKYGIINKFGESLDLLNLQDGDPLLGEHIYEAEQYSLEFQDSAVFFSEERTLLPSEIAMTYFNHECVGCTEGVCRLDIGA